MSLNPALRPRRRRRRRHDAFTLIELLVIVVIVLISAALAAPAIGGAIAESRIQRATVDFLRVLRRARSEALAYGRAHVVRFSSANDGQVRVFRGINSGCNTNDWNALAVNASCGVAGSNCIEEMLLTADDYHIPGHRVQMQSPGRASVEFCYEPSGLMRWRVSPAARFTDRSTSAEGDIDGGVQFSFTRRVNGQVDGVVRWVVVPLGADPRIRR